MFTDRDGLPLRGMITSFRGKYGFLSNMYLCPVFLDGVEYRSAEHAYQAAKFAEPQLRRRIRQCRTGSEARRRARRLGRPKANWDKMKVSVMFRILECKFSDPDLGRRLLDTYPREIVEGNYWGDEFWGVDARTGKGRNVLGGLLMLIREALAEGRLGVHREPTYRYMSDINGYRSAVKPLPRIPWSIKGTYMPSIMRRKQRTKRAVAT